MLPGRRAILFNAANGAVPSGWDIVVQPLNGGESKVIVEGGSHPRYVSSGHIVFARNGALLAVAFDPVRLQVTGAPVVVVESVMHGEGGASGSMNAGGAQFSISDTGSLAYVPGGTYPRASNSLVFVDRNGVTEPLPGLPPTPAEHLFPRFSPDGTRLTYSVGGFGDLQIWVYDIALKTLGP